jgi:phage gp46-like protein
MDVNLALVNGYEFDINIADDDIELGSELLSAVLVSLLSDSRNENASNLDLNKGGFWGEVNGRLGSENWLLFREKVSDQTIQRAETINRKALEWLLTRNIAENVNVSAAKESERSIALKVEIVRGNATARDDLWRELAKEVYIFDTENISLELLFTTGVRS